jgi:hypothetical protein
MIEATRTRSRPNSDVCFQTEKSKEAFRAKKMRRVRRRPVRLTNSAIRVMSRRARSAHTIASVAPKYTAARIGFYDRAGSIATKMGCPRHVCFASIATGQQTSRIGSPTIIPTPCCLRWVKGGPDGPKNRLPIFPQQRTSNVGRPLLKSAMNRLTPGLPLTLFWGIASTCPCPMTCPPEAFAH